jgi:hypothetical protein
MKVDKALEEQLRARSIPSRIVRIGKYADGDLCSSRLVVQRILDKRCHDLHHPEHTDR